MRSRLVLLVALAIAMASVVFAITRLAASSPSPPPVVHASLPPSKASYLGVYEAGAPPDTAPIAAFGQAAGKQPNIAGYYSGWAEPFATAFAKQLRAMGISPFVQIDPRFASVPAIAAGAYDPYLRSYADSVKDFGDAVVIGFGHEMNASWYPWGYKHLPPKIFIAAWRHIVTVFRREGADNVTWLWTINQDRSGTGPVADWWPGNSYVNWVGIDGYYFLPSDTFASVFGRTIRQVRAFTSKPVLLSETAVGPAADQLLKITNLFQGMQQYGTLGLVWFDKTQDHGIFHQNWRIEGSTPAEAAFRVGVADLTLAHP